MDLKLGNIVHGVGTACRGGGKNTHDHGTQPCALGGFEEAGIFPIADRELEQSFGFVVIERHARDAKKFGETLPSFEHIGNSLTQRRIVFHDAFLEEKIEEKPEFVHHGAAVLLMILKALLVGHPLCFAVIDKNLAVEMKEVINEFGVRIISLDKLAKGVGMAKYLDRVMAMTGIASAAVSHLKGHGKF